MALSDEMRRLTEHFVEAYDNRVAAVVDVHAKVEELRRDAAAFLNQLAAPRQAMAAEQRQRLNGYVTTLKSDTAAMLDDFRTAHRAMAVEQRQWLKEYAEELGHDVDELRRNTAAFLSEAAARRSRAQAELSEARQVWSSFTSRMQQRRAGRPAAPPPVKEEAPPEEEAAGDDLTAIRGIGTGTEHRLNEAGIFTYAQLGESTPEGLRQALGEAARRAEEWIEQARELAGLE